MDKLMLLDESVSVDEAQKVILGYCFHDEECELTWESHGRHDYGEPPGGLSGPKWAYRFYDCAYRSPGEQLEIGDVLAVQALELGIDFKILQAIHSVFEPIDKAVKEARTILDGMDFWDIDPTELPNDLRASPPEDSAPWFLYRAWWLLMSIDEVGIATTHKVLHHRWPRLFPLLDNKTKKEIRKYFGRDKSNWRVVFDDLKASEKAWSELEDWFSKEAQKPKRNGVPLTRLRLHDILLWCSATNQWDDALKAGTSLKNS